MVAKVEFYDGVSDDPERDGAEPIACVLLDHIPRVGEHVWLKPLGRYVVNSVENEIDTQAFNCGVRDICIWLQPDRT